MLLRKAFATPEDVDLFDTLRPMVETMPDDAWDARLFRMFDSLSSSELDEMDSEQRQAIEGREAQARALRALPPAARKRKLFIAMLHMAAAEEGVDNAGDGDDSAEEEEDEDIGSSALDSALEAHDLALLPLPPVPSQPLPPLEDGEPLEGSAALAAALAAPHLLVAPAVARKARSVYERMRSKCEAWDGGAAHELSATLWEDCLAPLACSALALVHAGKLGEALGEMAGLLLFGSEEEGWLADTTTYKDWDVFHAFFTSVSVTWQHLLTHSDDELGLRSLPANLVPPPPSNAASRPSPFAALAGNSAVTTAAVPAVALAPVPTRKQLSGALSAWEARTNALLTYYDQFASKAVGKARLELQPQSRGGKQPADASGGRGERVVQGAVDALAGGGGARRRRQAKAVEATYAY